MNKKVTLYLNDQAIKSMNKMFGKNKSFGVSWLLIQFDKYKDFSKLKGEKNGTLDRYR